MSLPDECFPCGLVGPVWLQVAGGISDGGTSLVASWGRNFGWVIPDRAGGASVLARWAQEFRMSFPEWAGGGNSLVASWERNFG